MSNQKGSVSAMVVGTSLCSIVFVLLTIQYTSSKVTEGQILGIHIFSHTILLLFGVISLLFVLCKVCTKVDGRSVNDAAQRLWSSEPLEVIFLWIFAIRYLIETILYFLVTVFYSDKETSRVTWGDKITWNVLLLIFLVLQTLLLTIARKHNFEMIDITGRKLSMYVLASPVFCNVVQCFYAMLRELRTTTDTFNIAYNQTENIVFENWIHVLQPYITPMRIEYNIMSIAFIFSFLKLPKNQNDSNGIFCMQNLSEDFDDTFSETEQILETRRTPKQVKSLFVVVFAGLVPTLPLVALEVYIKQSKITDTDKICIVYEFSEVANHSIVSLLCINGLCYLTRVQQSNDFRGKTLQVGNFLLVFSCLGVQMLHVFGGFGAAMNAPSLFQHLLTIYHIVGFIGVLLQTIFIINSKHLPWQLQIRSKLHSKVLVVLGIINFTFWLCDSFFVRHVDRLTILESNYFGKGYWDVASDLLLPLAIYYRFHSAMECYKVYNHIQLS